MTIDFKLVQLRNVPFNDVIELESMTLVKPVHTENALFPRYVTELGMVTEANPLQPSKAEFPISLTLLGMVTEARPLQRTKE